ncbi:MAG: hypothetical protein IJM25_00110 [Eubacterium sp.]|nr:hypothetical protein [Eubacterium sp.]
MRRVRKGCVLMAVLMLGLTGCGSDTSTEQAAGAAKDATDVTTTAATAASTDTEAGVASTDEADTSTGGTETTESPSKIGYVQINQQLAAEMMTRDDGHVVLDVRRKDEYDSGHIPGAVLLPNEEIGTKPPKALPDMDQVILVYCRSGVRSKEAAEKLADMGYKNVYEFGGILLWEGETVTEAPEEEEKYLCIYLGETKVAVTWLQNQSVAALKELLPLEINMSNFEDMEQIGPLGQSIPKEDHRITADYGDIVLYCGDRIGIFYKTSTNDYTPLGHIHLPQEDLEDLLSGDNLTVRIVEE